MATDTAELVGRLEAIRGRRPNWTYADAGQLRAARRLLDLSCREAAEVVGVGHEAFARWERNQARPKKQHRLTIEAFIELANRDGNGSSAGVE